MVVDAGLDNTGHDGSAWDAGSQGDAGFSEANPRRPAQPEMPELELPDQGKLAQDWITLWQSEITALAADPEMREAWQVVMSLWAGSMAAMMRAMPRAPAQPRRDAKPRHDGTAGAAGAADAPRATAAAAAPDARDAEIDRLARHVAALERRLADIERGGDPAVAPKRRSGRTRRK